MPFRYWIRLVTLLIGVVSGMNHQARMPSPTNASTAGILSELATTTFLMPTTHGLPDGIENSFGGDIPWADITAARAAALTAGYPPANMALLMAYYSMTARDINGSAQFAWFGTEGLLYSRGITAVNNPDGTNWLGNAPQLPVSEVYVLAMEAIAAGKFAVDIPDLSEKEGEGTTPVRYLAGSTPQTTFYEVISLKQLGDEYQRLKYVYLSEDEVESVIDGGIEIWYLVEDLSHLRGE
ncbi:MAG: hypothetical protein KF812_06890 [Fimbriimonadaceae bacterium]|nr:hypothetical protein [Fimbriimonadaceae bacterium]